MNQAHSIKCKFMGGLRYARAEIYEERLVLFRNKIADWQEAYMDRLNKEYIELLSEDSNPSEKFWRLERRIGDSYDIRKSKKRRNSKWYIRNTRQNN